jgi:hypothetical protein
MVFLQGALFKDVLDTSEVNCLRCEKLNNQSCGTRKYIENQKRNLSFYGHVLEFLERIVGRLLGKHD